MTVRVHMLAADVAKVRVTPNWLERLRGAEEFTRIARLDDGFWCWDLPFCKPLVSLRIVDAIERAQTLHVVRERLELLSLRLN